MAKPVIVTRIGKGSELSFQEGDDNFTNLQNATVTVAGDSGSAQAIDLNDTVTVAGGTGLSSAMTSKTVTLNLDNTAVTPGAYVKASITVDAQGRVTAASSGSADFVTADARSSISLTVQNAGGGAVAPQTFVITVQYDANTYQNVYYVDGVYKPVLALVRTGVYTFDQSDYSNTNHPLRFRNTDDSSFSTGVVATGTPGTAGAQVVFIVPQEAPSDLKYYCTVHGNGMGNNITVTSQQGGGAQPTAGSIVYDSATGVFSVTPTSLSGLQLSSEKNIVNGYAGLDANGRVASAQLPSYVDDVEEYANQAAFPATGETSKIYVALDNNKIFRWSGSAYVEISPSPGSTDAVTEGATNLYFTTQRARDAFSASTGITITNGAVATTITQYADSNARSAISVTDSGGDGSLAYDNATGVVTYTGPSASEVRAHISAGTGITITDGVVATTVTDTNTTFGISAETVSGGVNLTLTGSDASTDNVKLAEGSNITLTRTDADTITIAAAAGGIANVVEDTTPQLGGSLDVNGQSIVSVSNGNITLAPNGSGKVVLSGVTYPTTGGTVGQVLTSNGSGVATFATPGGGMPQALLYAANWNAIAGAMQSSGVIFSTWHNAVSLIIATSGFTLPAGTWGIWWEAGGSSGSSGTSDFRIQNLTASTTLVNWNLNATTASQIRAQGREFTISASTTFQFQSSAPGNPQHYQNILVTVVKIS